MSALQAAVDYVRRGWNVVPIPFLSKNPGFKAWQALRLTEAELSDRFGDSPQNVGVLMGEPSGWIIDVDLDHRLAIELADRFLPPTPAIFGRAGKPRSHRWYRCDRSRLRPRSSRARRLSMLVERGITTGCQTVVPPSTHESGEVIRWEQEGEEPADIEPEAILAAAEQPWLTR